MEKQSILDEIAEQMGGYVSDLRCIKKQKDVKWSHMVRIVELIETTTYSVDEWNEAVSYILDEKDLCATAQEAKQRLLEVLAQS